MSYMLIIVNQVKTTKVINIVVLTPIQVDIFYSEQSHSLMIPIVYKISTDIGISSVCVPCSSRL